MKRSEINQAIDAAKDFFAGCHFGLPEYAHWTPNDWQERGDIYQEVKDLGLGWDVTDFGSGDLKSIGRTIFTLRNGKLDDSRYQKPYAQKAMHMPEGQKSIIHYHREKMEDIHNQAGGNIMISFWGIGDDGGLAEGALVLSVSGRKVEVSAGEPLRLLPGESVCVPQLTYHQFWAEEGKEDVLSIEVSTVCNDQNDNFFWPKGIRFPEIEEDEVPRYLLCSEY